MITLLVMTHGRKHCIEQTVKSVNEKLCGPITRVVINNDSNDPEFFAWVNDNMDFFNNTNIKTVVQLSSGGVGFGEAIRNAWDWIRQTSDTPFIFHLEDDFLFNRQIDLWEMMGLLETNSDLAQLALMRQPWNEAEKQAGSLYKLHEGQFKWRYRMAIHDMWFTTNPCLYNMSLVRDHDWPRGEHSEGMFTRLLRDQGFKFAYMGGIDDEPWVTHIGEDRANGHGY